MEKMKYTITALTSAFFSFFGLLAVPILLLLTSNIIDYVTGLMATTNRKEKISSYKSLKGIINKVSMYLLIIVGFMIDILISYTITNLKIDITFPQIVSCVIAIWLICNEFISILENLIDIGINLPPFLLPIIKNIKNQTENKIPGKDLDKSE